MIRDALGTREYWDKWTAYTEWSIGHKKEEAKKPAADKDYEPQYVYGIRNTYKELILLRYSRGDPIGELAQYFVPLMDMWEEADRLGRDVWDADTWFTRHHWRINHDLYWDNFWLVGLALALELPELHWHRLLKLIRNEGEDLLLDRIIASRQPGRKIGQKLLYPKPYRHLLAAVDAPREEQPAKLLHFVERWYPELKGGRDIMSKPYWYDLHTNLDGGAYFGYWCVEAVAAVKAFGLDDSLCLGHPNYPGDLLRPNGPSTHPPRPEAETKHTQAKAGWLAKLFGKR